MSSHFQDGDRLQKFLFKMSVFGLVQYDRVLFLDSDIILLQV
jgi:alpha-N-acetylglucosamine transferase